jgi:hypothetical protein
MGRSEPTPPEETSTQLSLELLLPLPQQTPPQPSKPTTPTPSPSSHNSSTPLHKPPFSNSSVTTDELETLTTSFSNVNESLSTVDKRDPSIPILSNLTPPSTHATTPELSQSIPILSQIGTGLDPRSSVK